jgi:hypothetical protein
MYNKMNDNKEEEVYMAEGYDSLVLQVEWFFYVKFHLFWSSFILNFYGEFEGSHLHVPLLCGSNIHTMQSTSLLVIDTENLFLYK